jgi:dynein heavy chain 1, cytosolic
VNEESLMMKGMRIEGGTWSDRNVIIPIGEKEEIGKALPTMLMRWKKGVSKTLEDDEMMVPVYLNRTRKNLIMSLKLKCGKNKTTLYQKGIAIILWTN